MQDSPVLRVHRPSPTFSTAFCCGELGEKFGLDFGNFQLGMPTHLSAHNSYSRRKAPHSTEMQALELSPQPTKVLNEMVKRPVHERLYPSARRPLRWHVKKKMQTIPTSFPPYDLDSMGSAQLKGLGPQLLPDVTIEHWVAATCDEHRAEYQTIVRMRQLTAVPSHKRSPALLTARKLTHPRFTPKHP